MAQLLTHIYTDRIQILAGYTGTYIHLHTRTLYAHIKLLPYNLIENILFIIVITIRE